MNKTKQEAIPVFWENLKTKKRTFAGLAYFNTNHGHYRLKVTTFNKDELYYLVPKAAQRGATYFEIQMAQRIAEGRILKRTTVSDCVGTKFVKMDIPEYANQKLVMRLQ